MSFAQAVLGLQEQFSSLDWTLHDYSRNGITEQMYHWPGNGHEDIAVVIHKSNGVHEQFHRHDFFFFNYTYAGHYDSLSQAYNNRITIGEGELYAGQPLAGHALFAHDDHDTIIIGLLIKKEHFFRYFLPLLPTNSKLFHFFLDPKTKDFSDEYIHFKPETANELKAILELMVVEYASGKPDTQTILRSLAICYLSYIAREYSYIIEKSDKYGFIDKLTEYINLNLETVSLTKAAQHLGYHPNYLSALIKSETGTNFSELILRVRMERALIMLKNTSLSVNDISDYLGYSNTSNFYKAFKKFYGISPRGNEVL